MRFQAFNRKTGAKIVGTSDLIPGVAKIAGGWAVDNGRLFFDYEGYTQVGWDGQATDCDRNGHPLYIDESGDEVSEVDIEIRAVNDEDEPIAFTRRVFRTPVPQMEIAYSGELVAALRAGLRLGWDPQDGGAFWVRNWPSYEDSFRTAEEAARAFLESSTS